MHLKDKVFFKKTEVGAMYKMEDFDERACEEEAFDYVEQEDVSISYHFNKELFTDEDISIQTKKYQISQLVKREILDELKKIVDSNRKW